MLWRRDVHAEQSGAEHLRYQEAYDESDGLMAQFRPKSAEAEAAAAQPAEPEPESEADEARDAIAAPPSADLHLDLHLTADPYSGRPDATDDPVRSGLVGGAGSPRREMRRRASGGW